jgi:hypothetical protein
MCSRDLVQLLVLCTCSLRLPTEFRKSTSCPVSKLESDYKPSPHCDHGAEEEWDGEGEDDD